jgi:uroporphyrinogen III methyltransferase/synthase
VGKITEKKLLEYGIRCDYVPEDHTGEGLGRLLRDVVNKEERVILSGERSSESKDLIESRILLLQGNLADDTLLKLLPQAIRWVVYETLPVSELPDWKREAVESADAVVFASTSAVENFVKLMSQGTAGVPPYLKATNGSAPIPQTSFCIGRMTESAARKHGFETVTSDETTMDSLVKKIVEFYTKNS